MNNAPMKWVVADETPKMGRVAMAQAGNTLGGERRAATTQVPPSKKKAVVDKPHKDEG